ncbi:MAG: hypothetical protein NWP61_00525 [Rickettsiaceae bacterium]|nr:hypothetical protein [Rickettsiaceae bacterium]
MQRQIFPDTNFEDWVKSSPEHDSLKKLKNNLWSWHVSDELIPQVRESLRSTGMILCI